jgi:hypothetical protein
MDAWEFFQDARKLWRWRRSSADGKSVLSSTAAYHIRADAVADAISHGYVESQAALQIEGSSVNLSVLPEERVTGGCADEESEPLRRSGYNPYDTAGENSKPARKP